MALYFKGVVSEIWEPMSLKARFISVMFAAVLFCGLSLALTTQAYAVANWGAILGDPSDPWNVYISDENSIGTGFYPGIQVISPTDAFDGNWIKLSGIAPMDPTMVLLFPTTMGERARSMLVLIF